VATAKDLTISPRTLSTTFIRLYKFDYGASQADQQPIVTGIREVHKTEAGADLIMAMAPFQGKLLVGAGNFLRLYELGKKKFLRKSENKNFPTAIHSITSQGDRIYVGDLCECFHFVHYKRADKALHIVADSISPRYMTAHCLLDYDTVAGGDKFGNVYVSRLQSDVSLRIDKDPTGGKLVPRYGQHLSGAGYKLQEITHFHVGEVITSMQKTTLVPGGADVLIFSTVMGSLGVLIPFRVKEDVDFFTHLEMHMRQELPPLLGRDHLAFRSYYFPVKDVVDGDLGEMFSALEYDRQAAIAEELVSTPADVQKRLEEIRNTVL